MALSPMMAQYLNIKEKYPDCILFFRLGDFYEMFFEDAKTASGELELVLTGRDCGLEERAPMCGVPYHAADGYIAKLISKGYRVAVCEQMEEASAAKGIVNREVVRIISPGTVTEGGLLPDSENNYLAALFFEEKDKAGIAFADISTGDIYATEFEGKNYQNQILSELAAYNPKEIVISQDLPEEIRTQHTDRHGTLMTKVQDYYFSGKTMTEGIENQYGKEWFDKNPERSGSVALYAVGGLLEYINQTQKVGFNYLKNLIFYKDDAYLGLDGFTRRNLELTENLRTNDKKGSLLWVLDRTKTSPGARLLKKWVDKPLINSAAINLRQEGVQALYDNNILRGELTELLSKVIDMERLSTRLIYGSANARDLKSLESTIKLLPRIKGVLDTVNEIPLLKEINEDIDVLEDIGDSIENTITQEPSALLREGNIIKSGSNKTVDELRAMMTDGKAWISKIEAIEKEKTGIRTLKVGYNKVFGYYIEVSKSFVDQVPDHYIRRQTLTGGERYVTEELKDIESRVIGAKDRLFALEYELFVALTQFILKSIDRIQSTASALAALDVLTSFATVAREYNYSRPEVDISDKIVLQDSRHPVVEKFLRDTYFVPNDCELDCDNNRLMLITGPNMAGKSTYMRQVALCVIMAQIGSFVPAAFARIGLVDKVFTRVGATDDLVSGHSTFMTEMSEVAEILQNATQKSLIIYDEIGRGTSTYDGMSIAKAVVEFTCNRIKAKTLFATHYHELTGMEQEVPGVKNYNIAAKKRGNDIVFLRKIIKGATDDSYGIEVAQLAGVPKSVVKRAREILQTLDEKDGVARERSTAVLSQGDNISFEDIAADQIKDRLREMDLNTLTPYEALSLLFELKKMAE